MLAELKALKLQSPGLQQPLPKPYKGAWKETCSHDLGFL